MMIIYFGVPRDCNPLGDGRPEFGGESRRFALEPIDLSWPVFPVELSFGGARDWNDACLPRCFEDASEAVEGCLGPLLLLP